MGRGLVVPGSNRPAVFVEFHFIGTQVNHGFNSKDDPLFEDFPCSSFSVIRHLWVFMHLSSHTVPDQFLHHTVTFFLTMALNGITDVSYPVSGQYLFDSFVQGFFRNTE